MAFPGFDTFWNEAAVKAGLEQQAKDYYGRVLQYYIEEQGNISPSLRWEDEAVAGPYRTKGAWEVKDHTGKSIGAWQSKSQAEEEYNRVFDAWERNTYLGRAHQEMEEDLASGDLVMQNALKQYETTLGGIFGMEESKKLAYDAMMKDYLRQREQETSELALDKATTTHEWDTWQADEQTAWRDKRKETYSNLAKSGGRGGIAQNIMSTTAQDRYGTIGRKQTTYEQMLEQLQLQYQGEMGAIGNKEEMERLAYQQALKDFKQQRAEAELKRGIDVSQAELSKKLSQSQYEWELGRHGIEERQQRRQLAEQLKQFVATGVQSSQAGALAQYTAARAPYEVAQTNY